MESSSTSQSTTKLQSNDASTSKSTTPSSNTTETTTTPEFGLPLMNNRYHPKNYPFEYTKEEFIQINLAHEQNHTTIARSFRHFQYYPVLHPTTDIKTMVNKLIEIKFAEDFTLTTNFEPNFIAVLMYYGFLPIGDAYPHVSPTHEYKFQWLMPKLHVQRAVMNWNKFHISATHLKQSHNMFFSMNRDMTGVLNGCVEQHGDAWVYPTYKSVLKRMFDENDTRHSVKMISIEVWMKMDEIKRLLTTTTTTTTNIDSTDQKSETINDNENNDHDDENVTESTRVQQHELINQSLTTPTTTATITTTVNNEKLTKKLKKQPKNRLNPLTTPSHSTVYGPDYYLIAGEIGFTIDSTFYCSMTGFRNFFIDSSGTIQLYTLGQLLRNAGVEVWDLGMIMKYKENIGAVEVPRLRFVHQLNKLKEQHQINDPECLTTTLRIEESYNKLVHEQQLEYETNEKAERERIEKIKSNQYEKKLRWLIKKFGDDSEQVNEYISKHKQPKETTTITPSTTTVVSQPTSESISTIETTNEPTQQQSSTYRNPYELIPCKTILKLPSTVTDPDWVTRKAPLLNKDTSNSTTKVSSK